MGSWLLSLLAVATATIVIFGAMVWAERDDVFFTLLLVTACLAVFLIATTTLAKGHLRLATFLLLAFALCFSWWTFTHFAHMRIVTRWMLLSRTYQTKVSDQAKPAHGFLRHVEWDSWGFAGVGDTVVYLVLDPRDDLQAAAQSKKAGRFPSIPCEVPQFTRLESQWYLVEFYADTTWAHCTPDISIEP